MLILTALMLVWPALASEKMSSFEYPLREYAVIATKEGYLPHRISVFQGEKLRVFFTTTNQKSCMAIPSLNFSLKAQKGEVMEREILLNKPGTYSFHCDQDKIKGMITVQERFSKTKRRDPASQKEVWMPGERIW